MLTPPALKDGAGAGAVETDTSFSSFKALTLSLGGGVFSTSYALLSEFVIMDDIITLDNTSRLPVRDFALIHKHKEVVSRTHSNSVVGTSFGIVAVSSSSSPAISYP